MNLGPPIGGAFLAGFTVPEHAGEWSDAEPLDILARKQNGLDLHNDAVNVAGFRQALAAHAVGAR